MAAVNHRSEYGDQHMRKGGNPGARRGNTGRPVWGLQIEMSPETRLTDDLETFSWIETTYKTPFVLDHQRSHSSTLEQQF